MLLDTKLLVMYFLDHSQAYMYAGMSQPPCASTLAAQHPRAAPETQPATHVSHSVSTTLIPVLLAPHT